MELTTPNLVELDLDEYATTKDAAVDRLVAVAAAAGRATNPSQLRADVAARELLMPTGIEGGIGIPHARSAGITEPTVVFGRSAKGIDFGAADGPAHLVFLIAVPEGAGNEHMDILANLSRKLVQTDFRNALLNATAAQQAADTINGKSAPQPSSAPAHAAAAPLAAAPGTRSLKLVGVTSCPTGIAHTYMAAEALEAAAKAAGHTIQVETQGSGRVQPLDPAVIAAADGVIFAHGVEVRDKGRFSGKPIVDVGVKRAIDGAPALVTEIEQLVAAGPSAVRTAAPTGPATKVEEGAGTGEKVRQWLMTGVSYMIPFVAAGGILIALSFMLGGYDIVSVNADVPAFIQQFHYFSLHDWAGLMFIIGAATFGFLNAVLAGFIAYAIADRPGLAPGFVAGAAAGTIGAGFLGAIVGGLTGGLIALWISRWNVPKAIRGVMPVVIIPLLATLLNGALMLVVLGRPLAKLSEALSNWLNGLSGSNLMLLGIILGLMMAFDMGGPVNKVAYAFAVTGLSDAVAANDAVQLKVMAAVMAAGMVPPLAMALSSTVLRPKLYTEAERENGKAAWLLGASFITEGAIPFAASDPLRVIPSMMAGSAVTGGLVMAFGNQLRAPHGGIWVIGLVDKPFLYLIAILAGMAVAAFAVTFAKGTAKVKDAELEPVGAAA
ncbi:MAG: PTS fructose transporter subunit IIABC [Candidatus Nanopelagicales bacterium]